MASSDDMEKVTLAMNKASIQVVEEESEVKEKIDRHCGFCLTLVKGEGVKICSKCKRRAYCSKECQKADWKSSKDKPAFNGKIHGYGQGHKHWCGLEVGEEDLDWKVAPISESKGLGLVALRDIPPLFRIIVEGMQPPPTPMTFTHTPGRGGVRCFSDYHPGIDDLTPIMADPAEKFLVNGKLTGVGAKLGLRNARTNHNCDANARHTDDEEFHVMITFSNREIKKDEEICTAYVLFSNEVYKRTKNFFSGKFPAFLRDILAEKWGIICPPSCLCLDEEKIKMVETCKKLDEEAQREAKSEPKKALKKMEKIIEIAGKLGLSPHAMSWLYHTACEIALPHGETVKKGIQYLEMGLKYNQTIFHPENMIQVKGIEEILKRAIFFNP